MKEGQTTILDIYIDQVSDEKIARFIASSKENLETQLKRLETISPYKAHGIRRSSREIEDIRKTRIGQISRVKSALDVVEGRQRKPIRIIKDDDTILGFEIVE